MSRNLGILAPVTAAVVLLSLAGPVAAQAPAPEAKPAPQPAAAAVSQTSNLVTRAELERRLESLVPKSELARYATKEDVAALRADLSRLRARLEELKAQVGAIKSRLGTVETTVAPPAQPPGRDRS